MIDSRQVMRRLIPVSSSTSNTKEVGGNNAEIVKAICKFTEFVDRDDDDDDDGKNNVNNNSTRTTTTNFPKRLDFRIVSCKWMLTDYIFRQ